MKTSKIGFTHEGEMFSDNSKEELEQVKEILKDGEFFKLALETIEPHLISPWLMYADKAIFKDKELIKTIALMNPQSLQAVPKEMLSNIELIREIASLPGVNYERT